MQKQKKEKIHYIQSLRATAIISVLILHSISDFLIFRAPFRGKSWWAVNVINGFSRFGVPVFFMISGYLLLSSQKKESISTFLKKRFLKILLPFFIWNIIHYIFVGRLKGEIISISDFFTRFIQMKVSYHYWFIYTLLAIYLFVPVVKPLFYEQNKKNLWYLFFIILIPTTIAPFINQFLGVWLPLFVLIVEGYAGYFILGYLLGTQDLNNRKRKIIYLLGLIGAVSSILGTYLFSAPDKIDFFFNGGYQFNSYFTASAVFVFFKYHMNGLKNKKWNLIFDKVGDLSYRVYLMHVIVLTIIDAYGNFQSPWSIVLSRILGSIIICYVIAWIISKIKYIQSFI